MKLAEKTKKQLWIYVMVAYGITFAMGALMWFAYATGRDVSVFPNAQMFYPAAGTMLALWLVKQKEENIPKRFYLVFLILTGLMLLTAVLSVIMEDSQIMLTACQLLIIFGAIVCWIVLLTEKKDVREKYGLRGKKWKMSFGMILLFLVLYIIRIVVSCALSGSMNELVDIAATPMTYIMLVNISINFFLVFPAFFGEEYGWRYFLQPLLQKRYGKRIGVIVLGVVWGLWHLPVDFFYYTTPDQGMIAVVSQQITCITLGIFFAYAYMKTQNIWVPVILHFLNNNLAVVFSGNYSADVLQNQTLTWQSLLPALVINGVFFGGFLTAKVFRKDEVLKMDENM